MIISPHYTVVMYFIYGFSFYLFGVIILLVQPARTLSFGCCFLLLALFCILHGINEWVELIIIIGQNFWHAKTLMLIQYVRAFLLLSSFVYLFGFSIIGIVKCTPDGVKYFHKRLILFYVVIFIFLSFITFFSKNQKEVFLVFEVLTRYSVAFFGASLTAIVFLKWRMLPEIQAYHSKAINFYFIAIAILFLSYAFFAGLVVPKASFFPASSINYESFYLFFHVPVQLFRTICAVGLAICTFEMMRHLT